MDGHSAHISKKYQEIFLRNEVSVIGFAGKGGNIANSYPPSSNDLNPIENAIPEFRKGIWKLASKTMDQLYHAMGRARY